MRLIAYGLAFGAASASLMLAACSFIQRVDRECCPGVGCVCRDARSGRYVSCRPEPHGAPVGSAVGPDGIAYCRDERGREWPSRGECD
ncbi:MAG: hypothetical protein PHS14_02835 [Elusimicrobia bacterium]|nr:hypothetical protein [Elusimicrobiota bacterium]